MSVGESGTLDPSVVVELDESLMTDSRSLLIFAWTVTVDALVMLVFDLVFVAPLTPAALAVDEFDIPLRCRRVVGEEVFRISFSRTRASRSIIAYFTFLSWTRWAWLMILIAYSRGGPGDVRELAEETADA